MLNWVANYAQKLSRSGYQLHAASYLDPVVLDLRIELAVSDRAC